MSAKTFTEETQPETITDNLSLEKSAPDVDKLAALKAKMAAKEQEVTMPAKIIAQKKRSFEIAVIGTGQAGSRLAEAFYKQGYQAIAINTATQDLKHIEIPDGNKLVLEGGPGGASKSRDIGRDLAIANADAILELFNEKIKTSQVNILCSSLGGGSGSGSLEPMLELLQEQGKPIVVVAVLPMSSEDAQSKHNALEALSELAKKVQEKVISNLLVVDNSKLELVFSDVNQIDFYRVANENIAKEIDVFNTLSASSSPIKPLDSAEWGRLLVDSEGLSIFGSIDVPNYQEETAIAEAVILNLDSSLLAEGFDLKQTRFAGFMVVASEATIRQIPSSAINYASDILTEKCGEPKSVFKGVYCVDMPDGEVKVHSFFSGLGLPEKTVEHLKKDVQARMAMVKEKEAGRNLTLTLDTGLTSNASATQKLKDKISIKNSAFGKLLGGTTDRRK